MKYLFSFIITILLLNEGHTAESEAEKYRKCMELVTSASKQAVVYANDWIFSGGAVPAGHCKALGLLQAGQAKAAARLLEKLVEDMTLNGDPAQGKRDSSLKNQLYVQAALAWQEAGDLDKSYMAYSSAIAGVGKENPMLYDLYLERGTLQILRRQYKAAITDLTRAIEKNPQIFEGFLQRAKAYRKRKKNLKARLDLRIALKLSPNHPAIMLESGILFREIGHNAEARRAWQNIIDNHPESDYMALARKNIDLLKPQL